MPLTFGNRSQNLECGNDTLTGWHPKLTSLNDFMGLSNEHKVWTSESGGSVRFAWQTPVPEDGAWPSSFEDSLILTNLSWFKDKVDEKGALGSASRTVTKHSSPDDLNKALHKLLRGSFKKGDFAATLLEHLSSGEPLHCPAYISDALTWLEEELKPTNTGGQP